MKKITKILTIAIISILFITNVKADTVVNIGYDNEFNVNETIEQNKQLWENIREYLINNNLATSSDIFISDTMIMGVQNPTTICKIGQSIQLNSSNSSVWCDNAYVFSYDSNYNITYNGYPNYYYPGITLSTPEYIGYYYWFGGDDNTTLTITNNVEGYSYILNESQANVQLEYTTPMNMYTFINTLNGIKQEQAPICNATQVVGMFENPKEFNINITGTSNALKERIEGIITITYDANTIYTTNQWEIVDTTSEFVEGDYDFVCDSEYSKCTLTYSYNYEDDIDENIEINFNLKTTNNVEMPSFVRLYNCTKNYDNINVTYNYIKKTTEQDTTNNKLDNIVGGIGNILNFLNPSNLIYIVVPTEKQMQSLLNEMQESINSKLGILGLPLTIYTRFMNLANTSTQENWCMTWDSIKVPNFEDSEIIPQGQWCFNTILENQTINNFRNVSIGIIGGLILLSFVQYLNNVYHRVIDSPDRDEYLYITTEDIYDINDDTGEVSNHKLVQKKTRREKQ